MDEKSTLNRLLSPGICRRTQGILSNYYSKGSVVITLFIFGLILLVSFPAMAGDGEEKKADNSYHPLVLKLNKDGSKYIRFITWHQFWVEASRHMDANEDIDFSFTLRRTRLLIMAQVSPRFLIVTHFGANSISTSNMDPKGASFSPSFFIHDAWLEFAIKENYISAGAGLHYWNGISRISNQGTTTILTIDAPRFNWPTIGTTDQYARHLGIYLKGQVGGFDYRVSVNSPIRNTLDMKRELDPLQDHAVYINDGKFLYSGYFMYQLLDRESDKLPFLSGTHLGKKSVFNLGAGFYVHPQGSTYLHGLDTLHHTVRLFGADVFADIPFGNKHKQAFTGYFVFYRYNFGPNYCLEGTSDLIATGNIYYGQMGYLFPEFTSKGRLQMYFAQSLRDLDVFDQPGNTSTVGATWFILGHSAKISLEYSNDQYSGGGARKGLVRMQAAVML